MESLGSFWNAACPILLQIERMICIIENGSTFNDISFSTYLLHTCEHCRVSKHWVSAYYSDDMFVGWMKRRVSVSALQLYRPLQKCLNGGLQPGYMMGARLLQCYQVNICISKCVLLQALQLQCSNKRREPTTLRLLHKNNCSHRPLLLHEEPGIWYQVRGVKQLRVHGLET